MKRLLIFLMALSGLVASGRENKVEEAARDFVMLLEAQDFQQAVALFDSNMKAALSAERLQAIWAAQAQRVGDFQAITATRSERLGPYHVVFVTCRFKKASMDAKVVFDQASQIAGLFFLPSQQARYQAPPYAVTKSFRDVEVKVSKGQWTLPGSLSIPNVPNGPGPFPGVVLVHGSGPQDRDESIGPNKPFRDLAWGLASKGIVVLRYEKRTRQYAEKMAKNSAQLTVQEESIDDARAALTLLGKRSEVNRDRIFLVGHSLGGMLTPRIVKEGPGFAGVVIMAGNARPLEDLILEQTLFQASLRQGLTDGEGERIAAIKKEVARVKALDANAPSSATILGAGAAYWLDLKGYRPTEAARDISLPMLILQGAKDCQVSSERDFGEWRRKLSDKPQVVFKLYPNLNHLFMPVTGDSTGAEYQVPGHVAAPVVQDIADWILKTKSP